MKGLALGALYATALPGFETTCDHVQVDGNPFGTPVSSDNQSRVYVYPPPGMLIAADFWGECAGGRRGLEGMEDMNDVIRTRHPKWDPGALCGGVHKGRCGTPGGPVIKLGFHNHADLEKYRLLKVAELTEIES